MRALEGKKLSRRQRRYWRLRGERKCVDCEAGLTDDDGVRCVECRARASDDQERYIAGGGRAKETAGKLRRRTEWRAQGLCSRCGGARNDGHIVCSTCRHGRKVAVSRSCALSPTPIASAIAARAPFRTKRAEPKVAPPVAHRIITSVPPQTVPAGWTPEWDRREELLALGELVALRKVGYGE